MSFKCFRAVLARLFGRGKVEAAPSIVQEEAAEERPIIHAIPVARRPKRDYCGSQPGRGGSSRYKGVTWSKINQCWIAQIHVSGRNKSLGGFDSEDDAARTYDAAAYAQWGARAFQNFPRVEEDAPMLQDDVRGLNRCGSDLTLAELLGDTK